MPEQRAPRTANRLAASRLKNQTPVRLALLDIRSDVEFRKRRRAGKTRQSARPDFAHSERHDSQPRLSVHRIKLQASGDQRRKNFRLQRPVHE